MENIELVFLPGVEARGSQKGGREPPAYEDPTRVSSEGEHSEQEELLPDTHPMAATEGLLSPRGTAGGTGQVSLKRDITLLSAVGVITGQMIGSGIYVTPQNILAHAGSFGMCIILWTAAAVVAICGGLCYVELGLLVRKSGGEFTYLVEAYSFRHRNKGVTMLGALMGFLCVWVHFCVSSTSTLAISLLLCARYIVQPFFGGCSVSEPAIRFFAMAMLSESCMMCFFECEHEVKASL